MQPSRARSRLRRPSGPRFQPVPVAARHDGWTDQRQFEFIRVLAETCSVTRACAAVGMSRESAYRLKGRAGAGAFALAWKRALAPDFAGRPHRPRLQGKVDEMEEVEATPVSPAAAGYLRHERQFRDLLARLRAAGEESSR